MESCGSERPTGQPGLPWSPAVIVLKRVGVGYKVAGGVLSTKLQGSELQWGKVKTLNRGHARKD